MWPSLLKIMSNAWNIVTDTKCNNKFKTLEILIRTKKCMKRHTCCSFNNAFKESMIDNCSISNIIKKPQLWRLKHWSIIIYLNYTNRNFKKKESTYTTCYFICPNLAATYNLKHHKSAIIQKIADPTLISQVRLLER